MSSVLPRLLDAAQSVDLYSCHGATLATGQVVLALALEESQGAGGEGKGAGAGEVLTKAGLFTRVEELVDKFVAGSTTLLALSLSSPKIKWEREFFCLLKKNILCRMKFFNY